MTNHKQPLAALPTLIVFSLLLIHTAYAQTEGFNVKTPVQNISDAASGLIGEVIKDAGESPQDSAAKDTVCSAECFLVIPSVNPIQGRNDFGGTGLLSCTTADSGKLTPPLFYQITNLDSFDESGGGLIILVTGRAGVKEILSDGLKLDPENSGAGITGTGQPDQAQKTFAVYVKHPGAPLKGFDASGSALVFGTGGTFNAYQQELDPVDVMLFSIDVPPVLRGFAASLDEWRKDCK